MFGFIVTTHFNNYNIIQKCLNLLFENIPPNSVVLLYVNETTDKNVLNIKNDYCNNDNLIIIDSLDINNNIQNTIKINFEVFYINNQLKNHGLTGTWNQGIKYLMDNYNHIKIITILGHDTYVNNSINYIYKKAYESYNNNKLEYFGPLYKNWNGKNDELWQDEIYYKNYNNKFLIGSLLCIPINSLIKNKLSDGNFFNNNYPFGYNDIDWYNRFIKIGGKATIITECIIDHKYNRSWIKQDPRLNKNLNYYIKNSNNIFDIFNKYNLIKEKNFNWIQYLKKNRDLKFSNEIDAFNHYMSIGQFQKRPL